MVVQGLPLIKFFFLIASEEERARIINQCLSLLIELP